MPSLGEAVKAAAASSGCSAQTVYGGHEHAARQTVLALTAGRRKAVPATC